MATGDALKKQLYPVTTAQNQSPEANKSIQSGGNQAVGAPAPLPKASPEGYAYYDMNGQPYGGTGTSYWNNTAENQWYQGAPTGQITKVPYAPWQTPAGTQPVGGGSGAASFSMTANNPAFDPAVYKQYETAFGNLAAKMAAGNANEPLMNQQISSLVEGLGSRNTAQKQELAARLGSAGAAGGSAASLLQAADRANQLGLSQAVGGVRAQGLADAGAQQGQALSAYLNRLNNQGDLAISGKAQDVTMRGQDIQRELGLTDAQLQALQLAQQGQFGLLDRIMAGYDMGDTNLQDWYRLTQGT